MVRQFILVKMAEVMHNEQFGRFKVIAQISKSW